MPLADRLLDRQRALVVDHPERGIALIVGEVGILPEDRLQVRLTDETFAIVCDGRTLVSPKTTSDESMALLRGVRSLTILQQPGEGEASEHPGVPVVDAASVPA